MEDLKNQLAARAIHDWKHQVVKYLFQAKTQSSWFNIKIGEIIIADFRTKIMTIYGQMGLK